MTKQETIREAYGEYWEERKEHVDENGWDTQLKFYEINREKFDTQTKGHGIYISRPKSLQGIENNNGWIKIESEVDLPKEDCRCEFIKYSGKQLYGRFENRMGGLFVDESRRFDSPEHRTESVTHWKIIESSVKPIY